MTKIVYSKYLKEPFPLAPLYFGTGCEGESAVYALICIHHASKLIENGNELVIVKRITCMNCIFVCCSKCDLQGFLIPSWLLLSSIYIHPSISLLHCKKSTL